MSEAVAVHAAAEAAVSELEQPLVPESQNYYWNELHSEVLMDIRDAALFVPDQPDELRLTREEILMQDTRTNQVFSWNAKEMTRKDLVMVNGRQANPGVVYEYSGKYFVTFYQVTADLVRILQGASMDVDERVHPHDIDNLNTDERSLMWACMLNDVESAHCSTRSQNQMADSAESVKKFEPYTVRVGKLGTYQKNIGLLVEEVEHAVRYLIQGVRRMHEEGMVRKTRARDSVVIITYDVLQLALQKQHVHRLRALLIKHGRGKNLIAVDILPGHVRLVSIEFSRSGQSKIACKILESYQPERDNMCPTYLMFNVFRTLVRGRAPPQIYFKEQREGYNTRKMMSVADIFVHHWVNGVPTYAGWLPTTVRQMCYARMLALDEADQYGTEVPEDKTDEWLLNTLHQLWWRVAVMHEDAVEVDTLYAGKKNKQYILRDATAELLPESEITDSLIDSKDPADEQVDRIDIYLIPPEAVHRLLARQSYGNVLANARHHHTSLIGSFRQWKNAAALRSISSGTVWLMEMEVDSRYVRCMFVLHDDLHGGARMASRIIRQGYAGRTLVPGLGTSVGYNVVPWGFGPRSFYATYEVLDRHTGAWAKPTVCNMDLDRMREQHDSNSFRAGMLDAEWVRRAILRQEEVVLTERCQDLYRLE